MSFMKKDKDMNGGIDMMELMDQVNAMDEDSKFSLQFSTLELFFMGDNYECMKLKR